MKNNIFFISHSSELNGAELMLLQTLQKINRRRFKPLLLVPCSGPLKDEAEKINLETEIIPMKWWLSERSKIWRQPLSWLWNIKSIFEISKMIEEKNISLVFSNSSVAFSGALAARIKRIPHIWAIHEILKGKKPLVFFFIGNQQLVKLIHGLSTRIIVNSRATQKSFQESEKVRMIYNGLEVNDLESFSKEALRQEFGLEEEDTVLGVVGKICKEKGQREVVLALVSLLQKYPHLKLLLVGAVKDNRYYSKLQKIIKEYKLEELVVFTGYRRDILRLLTLMDLLVVASEAESFGRSVIEAMAAGTPVLAVKSGGIEEIITPGKDGFLVESREPRVIKEALEAILDNPSKRDEVSREGILTVTEKFSLGKQVEKIEKVINECLKES